MAKTMYQATGRRKSSVARVRLLPGAGNISQARQEHSDTESQEHFAKSMKRLTDLHSRQLVS